MDTLYKKHIIDHYRKPRNSGRIAMPDAKAFVENTSCGDEIELFLNFDDKNCVSEIRFESRGCAISVATMSMLSEKLVGKSKVELAKLDKSEVLALTGLTESSGRVKCGLIAWEAVTKAVIPK